MHLYNLTLQKPTATVTGVYGNFTGSRQQEFAVSRGGVLELLRPDENGKLQIIASTETFSLIRSLMPFRLHGAPTDYLVIGSDSGAISICEFDAKNNQFKRVHLEEFGKTGVRRIVPGQYLACDPKGRAIMIGEFSSGGCNCIMSYPFLCTFTAAVEKQKFVYVMNRDAAARLTISSPLEAHKSHTIVFDVVGVDVGFDNPIFACIEMDYTDADADSSGEAAAETPKVHTWLAIQPLLLRQSSTASFCAADADVL